MGIGLMVEVLDHYHGPDGRKLWLLSFAEQANDRTREGWPGRPLLAARTGRSASRASHIASELVAEGVIDRTGGGNRGGNERYALRPLAPSVMTRKGAASTHSSDASKGASRAHSKPQVKGAESRKKGAASSSLPAETRAPNPSVIQPSKPSSAHSRAQAYDDPRFAEFWDAYPKHADKRKAWRAWQAALRRGADPAVITAAAKQYAAQRHGQNPAYTKYPASWLNAESYADETAPAAAGPIETEYTAWMA